MHRIPALPVAFAVLCLAAAPASGADIQTVLLGDAPDHDLTDHICDADANTPNPDPTPEDPDNGDEIGQCTLRAAVQTANAEPGPDTIKLRATRYTLSLAGPGEDAALTGDLDITSDVTIDGQGVQSSLIDGGKLKDRIFDVQPGATLTLNRTSLLLGKTAKEDFDPGAPGEVSGGCLRSAGTSSLDEVFFYRCASSDDGGCMSVIGGTATVTDSVFAGCRAKHEGGCVEVTDAGDATLARVTGGVCKAGTGGGVAARGPLSLRNATFTLNKAKLGGGVAVLGDADATIVHSTLASNGSSNLLSQTTGAVELTSSIVWGAKSDCVGPVASGGGNLEGATTCAFTGPNDQHDTDPLLLPLAFNGGTIGPTAALEDGSPAVDHGVDPAPAVLCEDRDARELLRVARVVGAPAVVDAGAYESNAATDQTVIISSAVTSATVGVAYTYDVAVGTIQAGEPLEVDRGACGTFSLLVAPAGMTIDATTGVISWTPAADQTGNQAVDVRYLDDAGPTDTQDFTIAVAAAP
jgi:hypothetical protein